MMLPKYVYRPVRCTKCGWLGRRGNRLYWPACPRCGISGPHIVFLDPTLKPKSLPPLSHQMPDSLVFDAMDCITDN
jgi:hypothetical protein